jgi:2-succinyl-6-hydroxy-2,4-cyclohexadiene-1-carboxylate synthase
LQPLLLYRNSYSRISVNGVHIGIIQRDTIMQEVPTLVLLHGFTGSATSWGTLLDDLARLGMRVIALDMLGHGQSDAPDDPQRYSMQYCQADIISILQTLGIKRGEAILLGYSMGGRIALYCAFSGYFRALILESASPGLATPAEREQRRVSDEALAERIEREGIETFVNDWEQLPLFASQRNLPIEYWNVQRVQRLANRVHGLANSLRGIGTGVQPHLGQCLPTLTIPVILITGKLDSKFCSIAQQMAQQLPEVQLQIVPNTGHTVHLEQPSLFFTLVHNFIQQIIKGETHDNRMGKSR